MVCLLFLTAQHTTATTETTMLLIELTYISPTTTKLLPLHRFPPLIPHYCNYYKTTATTTTLLPLRLSCCHISTTLLQAESVYPPGFLFTSHYSASLSLISRVVKKRNETLKPILYTEWENLKKQKK